MTLPRHAATRYVQPLREGGSLPAVVDTADGGRFVVKFRGAGQGAKALIAELIVGRLAQAIGLPVPALAIVELSEAFGRSEPDPEIQDILRGSEGDDVANRVEFDPVPWNALGVWILTQMKRWGYLKGDVQYKNIVDQVYLMTDAKKRMKEEGILAPADMPKKIIVMGKAFDSSKPEPYVQGFAIKKA